ncbi:MAG: sialate O-acetylesterase [Paludibacter sp.]|nr:sialate O-acetylesterase [Paludibacter sp.]
MRRLNLLFLNFLLFTVFTITGTLKVPNVISDNMVLQQNSIVKLWGQGIPGSTVKLKTGWIEKTLSVKVDLNGAWETNLQTPRAGGPYKIDISSGNDLITLNNILIGEVWICAGQSNMSMPVKGFQSQPILDSQETIIESNSYPEIRMFTAERSVSSIPEFNVKGNWQHASINSTGSFSAIGYFYALELYKTLCVPIGIINLSWGGSNAQAWMSLDLLKTFPEIDISAIDMKSKSPQRIPTGLFNAMFYPVSNYNVKGIIWYQGENNIVDFNLYSKLFPAMVNEWRKYLNQGDVPFYYVQIAPYKYSGSSNRESAFLREVQYRSQYIIPNSGMVTTGDIGEEELIHASNKKTISKRLSYYALKRNYGFNNLSCSSPVYRKMEIAGNKITITFDFADGGLVIKGNPESTFEIAGKDGVYYPAKAKVHQQNGDKIEIWSDQVSQPESVRYCFKNYFTSTVFNNFMNPASPFRTDFYEK